MRTARVEERIVGVARRARRVERGGVRLVERSVQREAAGQVGIGDEELAERNGVGLAGLEHLLGGRLGEFLVGDIDAAERRLQLGAEPRPRRATRGPEEREPPPAELAGDIAEGRRAGRSRPSSGCRRAGPGAYRPGRAPHRDGGIGDLEHQPGTVLDRAAVFIGPMVRAVLQELVEQIAVGAVDLDAVEAGRLGVLGACAKASTIAGDLAQSRAPRA